MKDLSALTPPLLVGAVVVIAVVAFLRHEMGRARAGRADDVDNSPTSKDPRQSLDNAADEDRRSSEVSED